MSRDDVHHIQQPVFVTSDIHTEYVDDVAWVGDLVVSKSTCCEVLLWKPDADIFRMAEFGIPAAPVEGVTILRRFVYPNADVWFVHFGLHLQSGVLAVGNKVGAVFVWSLGLQGADAEGHAITQEAAAARSGDCTGGAPVPVRCVAVLSASAIVAGLDDGRVVLMQLSKP